MSKPYFKPWIGKNYCNTRILVLSESAYSWSEADGTIGNPTPSHPKNSVLSCIDTFPSRGYFRSMCRALCGIEYPSKDQIKKMWGDYAYTIYVQRTVGQGARKRPSPKQWEEGAQHFLQLIEEIRPLKVIVTGLDMWNNHMPYTYDQRDDYLQAYKLSDGTLVWCQALPHPCNSRIGFKWEKIGENIRRFKSAKLPIRK